MKVLPLIICLACCLCAQDDARRVAAPNLGLRRAIVIGNAAYPWKLLTNPTNDARDVADTLASLGFDRSNISLVQDAGSDALRKSMREFIERVDPGDLALVYYSGHGLEINGDNYLLPVDLPSHPTEGLVKDMGLSAHRIMGDLADRGARVKVLILDACRDNPLRATKSLTGGLAPMEQGEGALVVFATQAGRTASDAPLQQNGLFTHYLLAGLRLPGISLDEALKKVSRSVAIATQKQQVPAIYGLLIEDVIFIPGSVVAETSVADSHDPVSVSKTPPTLGNTKTQHTKPALKSNGTNRPNELEKRVIEIISQFLGVEESTVTPDAQLVRDLYMDDLDRVELTMEFESAFSINIPSEDAKSITTVRDAIEYISKAIKHSSQ